ncbi:DoxX family protein [Rossellomorea sp. RS05]|uniref:DoxX family protein n=1 Tax=Rossellomorea sp. RS05 TaxID=3149166 RepID=UPI00256FFFAA
MMGTVAMVLQILLGAGFLMFGWMKFTSKQMVDEFHRYRMPVWFRIFTGVVEVITAVLLIIGLWNETCAAIGALVAVVTMVGAIFTHLLRVKDPVAKSGMPFLLLILSLIVLYLNKGGFGL